MGEWMQRFEEMGHRFYQEVTLLASFSLRRAE